MTRSAFNEFVERHNTAWELGMAALAVAYVSIGFASDMAPVEYQSLLGTADTILTVVFVSEFAIRLSASVGRLRYVRDHALDLVALLPVARGLRIARLLQLLRLVRAFSGVRRAFVGIERLANHHDLGTLVIAWFGTMFLCSTVFYAVESDVNPGIHELGDALWWGIATLTGGTAEVHAITTDGRVATAALLILGVALFTAITAVLVSFIVSAPPASQSERTRRLREIAGMRDDDIITNDQFESLRAQALQDFAG